MRKFIYGMVLFLTGITIMFGIFSLSIIHPWGYNDHDGLYGFLLASKSLWYYILAFIAAITGFIIMTYETYRKKNN